jgi:curved DNA-binding protein CbpA
VDAFLEPREHLCPVPGESPYYRFQDLTLDEAEQAVLERLEQAPTIRSLYPLGEADRRALYSLILLERVELREGLATPGAAEPAGAAPSIAKPAVESPPQESPEDGRIREELARMAARLRSCDAFEVLDVPRETNDETVRAAYTALAKRTHPDRFAGSSEPVARLAEDVFARVSEAYELVRDRDSRLHYMRDQVSREREQAELDEGHRALRAELSFQAGEGALRARRYAEAALQFEKAMEAYPEEGEYRAWYGYAYWLEAPELPGRLEQALRHVQAGRKLAPDREKPYLFLGRLLKAADRPKQAEKMFTRAVQLAPDCVEALRELRLIHMRREKSKGIVQRILRR